MEPALFSLYDSLINGRRMSMELLKVSNIKKIYYSKLKIQQCVALQRDALLYLQFRIVDFFNIADL